MVTSGEAIYPALPESSANGDGQAGAFTVVISNFSQITEKKWHSEPFSCGGYKWRLLVFPRGNQCDFLSVYLDVADVDALSIGWQRSASFKLVLLCDEDPARNLVKDTQHTFNAREPDWGFTQFMPLADLNPFIANDSLKILCDITIKKDPYSYSPYDSKKETGFIGFKNQGATCYMNSLLQTLFHVPYFRKAVYHMPTTETDNAESSIPLALQTLFYKMQFQDTSVSTKELTKSFGWDQVDSFTQHDVQELNRVLCEKLEEKMKGTLVEKAIPRLFEGKSMSYVECINVDFKSARTEPFQDVQLDVKGCADVYASFDKYVEVEKLDGNNQYQAEGHGLQDARKGVWFLEFPPVLELQLKRFDYDFQRDAMVKINDRYEFPEELDLDKYVAPEGRGQAGRAQNRYTLHSVLVHSGGVHGGHYYAFIRPKCKKGEQWYRFDDERVTKEEQSTAVEGQFGGDDDPPGLTGFKVARFSNAYMLVYVRDCDRDWVLCDVPEDEVAEHLRLRIKREAEERAQRKKEKEEAHLYTVVKVATAADMAEQVGGHIHFDLVDHLHDKVKTFRVPKDTPFSEIQKRCEEELGVPVASQRFWTWAKRQNNTFRPNRPLTAEELALPVCQIKPDPPPKSDHEPLKLLLEAPFPAQPKGRPAPLPEILRDPAPNPDILLFFKFYDPSAKDAAGGAGALRFVGWRFEKSKAQVDALRDFCCGAAGLPRGTELLFFEEIKSEEKVMCEPMEPRTTLKACQLEDGDIVCFQRAAIPAGARFPKVPEYLTYIKDRMTITFKELAKPKEAGFVLELFKSNTYDEVTQRLAEKLGVADKDTIRLTAHNLYTHAPMPKPVRFRQPDSLAELMTQHSQTADTLYYEVLDIPVGELEKLKVMKVAFNNSKAEEVGTFTVRVPRDQTVAEALEELRKQLLADPAKPLLSNPAAELRMFEMYFNRIYKTFAAADKVDGIIDSYWQLRAEEVPEEEREVKAGERLLHCTHFHQVAGPGGPQVVNFGDPFLLKIGEEETLGSVRRRVQAKLGVADEEFGKWKIAAVGTTGNKVEYLTDDGEAVAARVIRRDGFDPYHMYLGLEHEDKHPKRQQNRYPAEKAVKIYN